jgi:hypothetical protein
MKIANDANPPNTATPNSHFTVVLYSSALFVGTQDKYFGHVSPLFMHRMMDVLGCYEQSRIRDSEGKNSEQK